MSDKHHPFISSSWLDNCSDGGFVFNDICGLCKTSLKGIQGVITPPWAIDCGLQLTNYNGDNYSKFIESLSARPEQLLVIDIPPCSEDTAISFSTAVVKQNTPQNFRVQWNHTRILDLPATLPSNRNKQVSKAQREGISCELVSDWSNVHRLHDHSRKRKDLANNSTQLGKLLNAISSESYSFAIEAKDSSGDCISSGGFVIENKRCIYSFGGQKRVALSAVATVSMLHFAMEVALTKGAEKFDFGGSSDPGVDRFYKEFGAHQIPKARLIRSSWWLTPILKTLRPDLF